MGQIRNKKTAEQAIREWYNDRRGRVELTPKHQEILQRVKAAYALMIDPENPHTRSEAAAVLEEEFGISERTAYDAVRIALNLYGDVNAAEKKGLRNLVFEYAQTTWRQAKQKGNEKAMAAAVATMVKIHGLDKEDPEMPEFEKLEPSVVVLNLPEGSMELLQGLLKGGIVNLNTMADAEDAEYEVVEEDGRRVDQGGDRSIAQPGQG